MFYGWAQAMVEGSKPPEEGDTSHEGRGRGQNLRILPGKILHMIQTQNTNRGRQ